MDWIVGFVTLVLLELVLGLDNIVFIGVLSERLPSELRPKARRWGLAGALVTRILLLTTISWMAGLTTPLFAILGHGISVKDLVLILGGLFLLGKSTLELHHQVENGHGETSLTAVGKATFMGTIGTIMLMDVIFSLDSVITAVGMVNQIPIMVAAVVIAMVVMVLMVNPIADFVSRHPTIKVLALSFLLLIGFTLIISGFGGEIAKGYIYFAMGFSVFVEMLNMRMRVHRS